MAKIGIADTMFSRVDMFSFAQKVIEDLGEGVEIERYTVPGIKDLPVASKLLIEQYKCDIVLALGMVGRATVDETCAHEASSGIIQAQLMTNKHILGVFVHMQEAKDEQDLLVLAKNRTVEHTKNALALLGGKEVLSSRSGQGVRQGREDEGPVKVRGDETWSKLRSLSGSSIRK